MIYDIAEAAANGLGTAREQLERLRKAIASDAVLAPAEVYLIEYPDPTRIATGAAAPAILNEIVPGFQVNRRELELLRERLLRPLNAALRRAADQLNWTFVEGISESFRTHGYAATDTWFVRAKESEELQGPRLSPVGYVRGEIAPGMLHPNRQGHQVIADRLFRSIRAKKAHPCPRGAARPTRHGGDRSPL